MNHDLEADTLPCFSPLNDELSHLLRELTPAEWLAKTHFPSWTVKDVVSHLLDTSLRRLSSQRDEFRITTNKSQDSVGDLAKRITLAADRWADATAFLSTTILTELTIKYQNELIEFFKTLNLDSESLIPVSWAGQTASTNRFDISREYTERWHHQMHIREALAKPLLLTRDLYHPVLCTFMNALPYHYENIKMFDGYTLEIHVPGEAGGRWSLQWEGRSRILTDQNTGKPNTKVTIEPDSAWKIFTRFNSSLYDKKIQVDGDITIGNHILEMKCVMIE